MRFKLFQRREKRNDNQQQLPEFGTLGWDVLLESRSKPLLLSAVYRCVDLISDSIGVLPFITYNLDARGFKTEARDNGMFWLLNTEPNELMTRYVFMKTMMTSVLLRGNGYALIERSQNLQVEQLTFLHDSDVIPVWQVSADGQKHLRYIVQSLDKLVEPKDMIHVKNFSYDGVIGVSTLTHARQTIDISTANEESAAGFFKSGSALQGILTVEGARLSKEQKKDIYAKWAERMNPILGNGMNGGIQILEGNMKYQPISVTPSDAQMLESRQYNVVDICRFFSVSPVKAFDLSKSSYATVEATQLQFLTDTMLAVITKMEQEFNRKLLLPSERTKLVCEFDTSVILRTDKDKQATYWRELFNIGAATPNEVRKQSNLPPIAGGDEAYVQVNMTTLKAAANAANKTE